MTDVKQLKEFIWSDECIDPLWRAASRVGWQ